MYRKIFINLRGILYVQIWENRLKVTNIMNQKTFDQAPNIAIKTEVKGGKKITAYGNDALSISDNNTVSYNPFSHPRMLLADVIAAQEILKFAFKKTKSSFLFAPIVIMQPMDKLEGKLTYFELSGFRYLAKNSGAKEAFIYEADEEYSEEFTIELLKGIISGEIGRNELLRLTNTGI